MSDKEKERKKKEEKTCVGQASLPIKYKRIP